MKRIAIFWLAAAIICQVGCDREAKFLPVEYSDPYFESFRGKAIKYVIVQNVETGLNAIPDTIELDQSGNIIRINSPYFTEKRSYSANNFLERRWHRSDVTANYIVRYSAKRDTLVQCWRTVSPTDWQMGRDTVSSILWKVFLRYNKEGRVIEEHDARLNHLSKYIYQSGKLIRKDVYNLHPNGYSHSWVYDYDERDRLQRITQLADQKELEVFYYSSGLLDSSITRLRGSERVLRYSYIYDEADD